MMAAASPSQNEMTPAQVAFLRPGMIRASERQNWRRVGACFIVGSKLVCGGMFDAAEFGWIGR